MFHGGSQISDGAGFLPLTIPQRLPTNGWFLLFTFKQDRLELLAVERCKFTIFTGRTRKNQLKKDDPKKSKRHQTWKWKMAPNLDLQGTHLPGTLKLMGCQGMESHFLRGEPQKCFH